MINNLGHINIDQFITDLTVIDIKGNAEVRDLLKDAVRDIFGIAAILATDNRKSNRQLINLEATSVIFKMNTIKELI